MNLARWIAAAGLGLSLAGCAALSPPRQELGDRLAVFPTDGLPVEKPVTIHWNDQQIPYVVAETDADAAFALGMIHAHLRGAQLALLKRVSQGRLSEMAGPITNDIDHGLRILNYGKASKAVIAAWPEPTRRWVNSFVAGLNHYQQRQKARPPEFGLLHIDYEPWTAEDLLAIGRLAGTDVTWLAYFSLLPRRQDPDWAEQWRRALISGGALPFQRALADAGQNSTATLAGLFAGFSRSGSNTIAVAPQKSATGAALIANDPHLGLALPNLWLLAGIKSPSFNTVGMMVPGIPFVAVGRSPHMSWGGTNMRAASSELYDISRAPDARIETQNITIDNRFWFDADRQVRTSNYGPIVSDIPFFRGKPGETIALRWVGHEPTDEITAFLRAMQSRTPEEFRAAFASFGVSAQNMLFADAQGNIGHVLATQRPQRPAAPPADLVLDASDPATAWPGFDNALTMPATINPPEGFLASANNRPRNAGDRLLGYFFSPDDRVDRLAELAQAKPRLGIEDLKAMQRDVYSRPSHDMAKDFVRQLQETGAAAAQPAFVEQLAGWDGRYNVGSRGAVAFETLLYHVANALYAKGDAVPPGASQWGYLQKFTAPDLAARADRAALLAKAVAAAAADAAGFKDWGDMHKVRLAHNLGMAPVIGSAFVLDRVPAEGSRETLWKSAHDLVRERHDTRYGAQARHISDMSDPDANWFVLLGGNDGWLGSTTFADQADPWFKGEYVQVPLRPETVAATFRHRMTLRP